MSRQAVQIAEKFYRAQNAMKFLFKDKYMEKITPYRAAIEAVMKNKNIGVMLAVTECVTFLNTKYPHDNGVIVALVLSAAVEQLEGCSHETVL